MQQTVKYQLNLIETDDVFSPNPLNENAQKTEAALAGIQSALTDETDARVQAVAAETAARKSAISAETTARTKAISAETTARTKAISAETTARTKAISDEATARANAISAEAKTRADADAEEVAARKAAISAEATARANAISAETTARTKAVSDETSARKSAVSAEATARANADTALANRVTALEARKIVAGYYIGNGTQNGDSQFINLGFTPAAVIVNGILCVAGISASYVSITTGGFKGSARYVSGVIDTNSCNINNHKYPYIAFL